MNKRMLLIPCFLIAGILFTYDSSRREEEYKEDKPGYTQINDLKEPAVFQIDYKNLLLRLIHDEIAIVDEEDRYYFSDVFSASYIKMLSDSEFYIFDINGDGISDIGIQFPTKVTVAYCCHPESGTLSPPVDTHMYTEMLGNGQIMTIAQTSTRTSYQCQLMNSLGERIAMITFDKEYYGNEEADNLYSIRFMVNAKSKKFDG